MGKGFAPEAVSSIAGAIVAGAIVVESGPIQPRRG